MAFLVFAILFGALFYLHFGVAHQAWRRIRGRQSTELDMGYVRLEDYFGQSFRTKVREWLATLPAASNSTAGLRVYDHGRERIYVASRVQYPEGRVEKEVLITEGEFGCGPRCDFRRELLARGDCAVGDHSAMQAVAADGALTLGEAVTVRRWVDAAGKLTLGRDTAVGARATSRTAIEFQPGAQAASLFAPEIFTEGRNDEAVELTTAGGEVVQIPHRDGTVSGPRHGFDPRRLYTMGGGTYLYDGDLLLTAPLHLRAPLVVRGRFDCPKESLLEEDLKAYAGIRVGPASVVKGNLVSKTDILLGADVFFQGLLHAQGEVRLSHGVRGLRPKLPVAAYAGRALTMESNVVVNGKVASAHRVVAVSTPLAWLNPKKANV